MESMITSLKRLVSGTGGTARVEEPAFYLQSTITEGMLPFTNASVEVLAFYDKEHYQKMANVEYSWFRKIEGAGLIDFWGISRVVLHLVKLLLYALILDSIQPIFLYFIQCLCIL